MKTYLPDPLHEKLLQASLWRGEESIRCFYEWKNNINLNDLDYPSQRLLPLLYKNLLAQGIQDSCMIRLKGVYRYWWVNNQRMISHAISAIKILKEGNIPNLLLKGAGLTFTCYEKDFGIRPMTDLDILVPENQASEAILKLEEAGLKFLSKGNRKFISVHHAGFLKFSSGIDLDLHWHILFYRARNEYDQLFWEKAVPVKFPDTECLTLCETDHLIHACLHGVNWAEVKAIRWVSDAYQLIEKSSIDWNRVIFMSQKLETILPIRDMLRYLKIHLRANIPLSVLESLEQVKCPPWQQKEYKLITQPFGFLGQLPLLWLRATTPISSQNLFKKVSAFLEHLKSWYAVDNYFHLGKYLGRLLIERGKNRISYFKSGQIA